MWKDPVGWGRPTGAVRLNPGTAVTWVLQIGLAPARGCGRRLRPRRLRPPAARSSVAVRRAGGGLALAGPSVPGRSGG
jgi:hypothetical protein